MQMAYAAAPFFEINQLFAKASLLILYYRIFSTDRTFVVWTCILAAVQLAWFISIFFSLIFMCVPVPKWWDVLGTVEGWCVNDAALLAAEETINSCVDFAMMALAIFMVRKLQMKANLKRKLAAVFIAGGLSGILGFVKIAEVYAIPDMDGSEFKATHIRISYVSLFANVLVGSPGANVSNGFWDLLQMAVTIFCCCAPIYKTLTPPRSVWSRFKSSFTSLGSTSRLNNRSTGHKKTFLDGHQPHGVSSSQVSTSAMWPRFHAGDTTQHTWAEIETQTIDEIPLRKYDPKMKISDSTRAGSDMV